MSLAPVRVLSVGDVQTGLTRLRDVGHEVVVLRAGATAAEVAAVAVQEDVDLVAVTDPELGAASATLLDDHVVVFWITSESGPS
jgi:hypothetical protein